MLTRVEGIDTVPIFVHMVRAKERNFGTTPLFLHIHRAMQPHGLVGPHSLLPLSLSLYLSADVRQEKTQKVE